VERKFLKRKLKWCIFHGLAGKDVDLKRDVRVFFFGWRTFGGGSLYAMWREGNEYWEVAIVIAFTWGKKTVS
jgi:hypothetical protein